MEHRQVPHSVIFQDKPFDRLVHEILQFYQPQRPESLVEDAAECGGYFVSTGAEKVVIGQEGPRTNFPFVTMESDGTYKCECRSFNEIKFRSTSTLYVTLAPPHATETMAERRACVPRITVHIPFVQDPLPLPVTFKLLGVTDTEAMVDFVAAPGDPQWFRDRVLGVVLHNLDAVVMSQEFAITRLAHDRGQSYTASSAARKRRQDDARGQAPPQARDGDRPGASTKQVAGLISTEFLPHQGCIVLSASTPRRCCSARTCASCSRCTTGCRRSTRATTTAPASKPDVDADDAAVPQALHHVAAAAGVADSARPGERRAVRGDQGAAARETSGTTWRPR